MNVSFIGSGNLAWHLAPAFDNTGFTVREIYSRQTKNAQALVQRLYDARVQQSLDLSQSESEIFIISVSDDVIEEIVQELILPEDAMLFHTSGSQPLNILDYAAAKKIGVFYPLQTFTKNRKVDFEQIPVFIESEDADARRILMKMAQAISKRVYQISSEQRVALHVAAVFASNFTNHMLTISRDVLTGGKLEFEWLKPLIAETINKALTLGPDASQTGPAKRADLEILDRHVTLLQDNEPVAEIYRVISQHIIDRYS